MLINKLKNNKKEVFMEHIKKVKIGLKKGFISIIETLWTIGTSIVAGDVLKNTHNINAF